MSFYKFINQPYHFALKETINKHTRLVLTVQKIMKIRNSRLGIRETKTLVCRLAAYLDRIYQNWV